MRCVACGRILLLHIFLALVVFWIVGHDGREIIQGIASNELQRQEGLGEDENCESIKALEVMSKWGLPFSSVTQPQAYRPQDRAAVTPDMQVLLREGGHVLKRSMLPIIHLDMLRNTRLER